MEDPPFQHLAIVGLGLIGGSIALGARDRWPGVRVTGVDRQGVLAHALGSGAVDRGVEHVRDAGEADLVVLAAPVRENVHLLAEIARQVRGTPVITDVGGTKRDIVNAAAALSLSASFVGGHPIGGAERGGFGFARPDLFRSRPWIFTPDARVPSAVLERLYAFVQGLGARPSTLDPARHDRIMAFLSHLPQLTATALMETVGRSVDADGMQLAGRGLVDTTRLASSPASVWRDVCVSNADEIAAALDLLLERLTAIRADLAQGSSIEQVFESAASWRAELMKGRDA